MEKGWDVDLERLRPRTRAACPPAPTPCPFVGCRHHLAITVDEERGSIKETFPDFGIVENPSGDGLEKLQAHLGTCCALQIAESAEEPRLDGVGGLLQLLEAAGSGRSPDQVRGGMNLEEVGRAMNVSTERMRQLLKSALQSMRVKLRRHVHADVPLPYASSVSFIEERRREWRRPRPGIALPPALLAEAEPDGAPVARDQGASTAMPALEAAR